MENAESGSPKHGDFASWVDEKSEALKFQLGDKFPVPPTLLDAGTVHPETTRQKLEEVLLEHEEPTQELLDELAAVVMLLVFMSTVVMEVTERTAGLGSTLLRPNNC